MIHLLYGEDDFTIAETLSSMKKEVGSADVGDVNLTVFDGTQIGLDELMATASTVPFLAEKRLVAVEGLLGRFERRSPSRSRQRSSGGPVSLGVWEGLAEYLPQMPESTDLVFVDGPLTRPNPLLAAVQSHAKVRTFSLPGARQLREWIRSRAVGKDIDIETRAIDTLAQTIGSDLRVVASELDKLSLYCSGASIRHEDVQAMVSYSRDANIFRAVDAILEGRVGVAVQMVHQILQSGRSAGNILALLARQVRLLMLAKDLRAQRVPASEHGRRLGLSGYPLTKIFEQEKRFTPLRLVQVHRRLLEADLSNKSSTLDDGLVLDLLVAELATGTRGNAVVAQGRDIRP